MTHDIPTDREAVKRLQAYVAVRTKHIGKSSELGDHIHGFGTCDGEIALYLSDIRALLARAEAAEAKAIKANTLLLAITKYLKGEPSNPPVTGVEKKDLADKGDW